MAGEFKHSSKHSGANFESRKLRWAEFSYSVIASARLRGADLRDADTRYSVASDADFTDADLRRAKLSYSVLSGARFDGARLEGARLEGANLNYSVITSSTRFSSKTTYDATTRFPRGFDPQKAGLTFVESGKEADSEKSAASRAASKVSREPPQRTFKAVLHPTASGLPNAGRYGDFTLSGPVTESFVALPAPVGEVLCDPSGRHVIRMGGHDLYRLDLKNQTATRLIARDVPEISWAMGIAYDTKRDRLLLATLGGEGFLYSYKPDDDAWSLIASLENVDLTAIAYYEPLDRILGLLRITIREMRSCTNLREQTVRSCDPACWTCRS